MPGTNHDTESGFMDALPISLRDASVDVLQNYRLKQLIEMKKMGPNDYLKEHFPQIKLMQWIQIFDAVILTKVSYFTIDTSFPIAYIDKLIEIIIFSFNRQQSNIRVIYTQCQKDYPYFADWIKKTLGVRNKIILAMKEKAQAQARKA